MPLVPGASAATVVFWNTAALGAVAGLFVALWTAIGRSRRGTPALDAALAFAVLVCTEAGVLDILSVFHGVDRTSVLVAHVALIAVLSAPIAFSARQGRRSARPMPPARTWWWGVGALVPLVVASAVRYAPNSGDAMTYHLARVAHWIQNGSVAPYPSLSVRQTVAMPGAEYMMTALLAIAGSDHLAALPQFAAWLIVGAAAPSLARLWGAPSRYAWLAAPAVMTAPMIVLQASSTQNDLVAGATAVAVVAASLPLLHGCRTPKTGSLILFGFACAAAGLVKATAVIAALPFAAVAAANLVKGGLPKLRTPAAVVAVLVPVCLVLPDAARRETLTRTASPEYVYGGSDEWLDRFANQGRVLAHHVVVPFRVGTPLDSASRTMPSRAHEDYAGNPLQLALIVSLLSLVIVRWRRIPRRARIAAGCWLMGWVVIHAILKDNEFLSRLEVPWFVLLPVLAGSLSRLRLRSASSRIALAAPAIFILNGAWVAGHNELRPPLVSTVGPRESHYFLNGSLAMNQQQEALRIAEQAGCPRIALFMGESGFDYPISRAAMAAGLATRHLLTDDGWACEIYVERLSWGNWNLPRPQVALDSRDWSVAAIGPGGAFVYLRRPQRDVSPR
jgi:hypothetical protein